MKRSFAYRKHAQDCQAMAELVTSEKTKSRLIELARSFHRLAQMAELADQRRSPRQGDGPICPPNPPSAEPARPRRLPRGIASTAKLKQPDAQGSPLAEDSPPQSNLRQARCRWDVAAR